MYYDHMNSIEYFAESNDLFIYFLIVIRLIASLRR